MSNSVTASAVIWQPTCLRELQPDLNPFACFGVSLATHLPTRIATELAVTDVINIKLATHLPTRIATGKRYESPCIRHCLATHLPMRIATNDWRSLKLTVELATHLYTRIATTYEALANMYKWTGNPLVYEDCNSVMRSYHINPNALATHLYTRIATAKYS